MAASSSDRSTHFPAIERKHGQPMSYWFGVMKELAGEKYADQVAYLRENHGFSQAHANALVMYSRGSTSSKRYTNYKEFLATLDADKRKTVKAIFAAISDAFPDTEIVIAWNHPMVKQGKEYLFGLSVAKEHILLAPFGGIPKAMLPRLKGYEVQKKTFRVPVDWQVDKKLLKDLIRARIAALA